MSIRILKPSLIRGDRVKIPVFDVCTEPRVALSEIKTRRFDLIERARAQAGILVCLNPT